jgi:hypothetical protein
MSSVFPLTAKLGVLLTPYLSAVALDSSNSAWTFLVSFRQASAWARD